jgi:acyl dehydratase
MIGLFLHEFEIGRIIPLGSHTFTAEAIRAYSTAFAPVGFHMNAGEAAKGLFGKTAAAGFHTCSAWMRCYVATNDAERTRLAAEGKRLPQIGPSPGVAQIRWPRPVHAGDKIAYRSTVTAKRELASRPGWGMVTFLAEGHNPAGEEVMRFEGRVLVEAASA